MMFATPAAEQAAPAYVPPKRALLCIDRVGQNGRLNIVPTAIRIASSTHDPDYDLRVTLLGDQNVCFRLAVRKVEIKVRFTPSPLGPGDPKIYWTSSFPITLKEGMNEYVLDEVRDSPRTPERGDKTGWHRLWKLQPAASYCRTELVEWGYCDAPDRR
jgi:hypothetical protein